MSNDTVILGSKQEIWFKSISSGSNINFTAWLTGYDDTYTSNWDRDVVYGRQDPISTFKNTERKLSFAISVPSSTIDEAIENMNKIKLLQKVLYPRYKKINITGDRIISTPPLIGIKFYPLIMETYGKSYDYLYGTIDSVSLKPDINEGFVFTSGENRIPYPKSYVLDIKLNVIHKNNVGWDETGTGSVLSNESKKTKKLPNKFLVSGYFGSFGGE